MALCFCPLRSGSSGNVLFVQAGNTRVLVDAGLSGRAVERALDEIGVTMDTISAILVTHEHSDHIAGAGILSKRHDIPVYATEGTWAAMDTKACMKGVTLKNRRMFESGGDFYVQDLAVASFAIPHDAADPVGFALMHGGRKLCVATDLGHIEKGWIQAVSGADLVLLEANHDPELLRASTRYHARLKSRILGRKGHLSNGDSGTALTTLVESGLTHVVLGHLSAETNTPELAHKTVCDTLTAAGIKPGNDIRVDMAWRDRIGHFYEIG